jgi:hypothetical protein
MKKKGKAKAEKTGASSSSEKPNPVANLVDNPVGACYWVDTFGQNHCKMTTQSACKGVPGSMFRANKQCPGGV